MIKLVGLRVKTYSYLIEDGSKYKKVKDTKNMSSKENLNLEIIKAV